MSSSDMGISTVCTDNNNNQHKLFHPSHHLYFISKKTLREIDIPPRKLLSRRAAAAAAAGHLDTEHVFMMDSPKGGGGGCCGVSDHEAALLQKFLPYNNITDDDDDDGDVDAGDPYSSDHFRMYEFKVRKCTRSRSHDWTDCPFAHPGEKARRRDPRRYHYTGTVCAEFRRGSCSRGDNCEFAHGVFECWLHPSRYRTEACKDGKNCKRKVCFFAHTPRQLRVIPPSYNNNNNNNDNFHEINVNGTTSLSSSPMNLEKNNNNKHRNAVNHCCMYCHSPTSTLIGMSHLSPPMSPSSHTLSPPLSPVKSVGGFSRYKLDNHHHNNGLIPQFSNNSSSSGSSNSNLTSYKDALNELMSSLEAMQVNESPSGINSGNLRWLDVNFNCGDDQQQQFILSPSTPTPGSNKFFNLHGNISDKNLFEENKYNDGGLGGGPDLGWVNDLLT